MVKGGRKGDCNTVYRLPWGTLARGGSAEEVVVTAVHSTSTLSFDPVTSEGSSYGTKNTCTEEEEEDEGSGSMEVLDKVVVMPGSSTSRSSGPDTKAVLSM